MEINEIKKFCIRELEGIESRNSILDIFYILLKDQGKSYIGLRTAWIKMKAQQLDLFNEGKNEINMLYMRKIVKRKS